jgi:phage shock protein PspC (stress-responsive transcriptional regulator)
LKQPAGLHVFASKCFIAGGEMPQDNYNASGQTMKRMYRSTRERVIGGVCAGFAEYFGLDPALVRILFLALLFFGGMGFLVYILAWIIVPKNPDLTEEIPVITPENNKFRLFAGLFLLIAGIILLLRQLAWHFGFFFFQIPWRIIWSVILITGGLLLLLIQKKRNSLTDAVNDSMPETTKKVYKSSSNRMIAGVCGGIAEYFNIDPTLVRMSYAILSIASIGIGLIIYIIMAVILPTSPDGARNFDGRGV